MNIEFFEESSIKETTISEKLFSLFSRCSHALGRGHYHMGGVYPAQARILFLLMTMGTVTQRELQRITRTRAASLSELLSKLDSNGFIIRTKDEHDRRTIIVKLTDTGKKVISDHMINQQQMTSELFSPLTEQEQYQLLSLLEKLTAAWRGDEIAHHHMHHHEHNRRGS